MIELERRFCCCGIGEALLGAACLWGCQTANEAYKNAKAAKAAGQPTTATDTDPPPRPVALPPTNGPATCRRPPRPITAETFRTANSRTRSPAADSGTRLPTPESGTEPDGLHSMDSSATLATPSNKKAFEVLGYHIPAASVTKLGTQDGTSNSRTKAGSSNSRILRPSNSGTQGGPSNSGTQGGPPNSRTRGRQTQTQGGSSNPRTKDGSVQNNLYA